MSSDQILSNPTILNELTTYGIVFKEKEEVIA